MGHKMWEKGRKFMESNGAATLSMVGSDMRCVGKESSGIKGCGRHDEGAHLVVRGMGLRRDTLRVR